MILKKIHGAAGADYFVLLAYACPRFGTFSAEDDIAEVAIFAGMQIMEGYNGNLRQLISFYKDKNYSGNRMIAYCRRMICKSTR